MKKIIFLLITLFLSFSGFAQKAPTVKKDEIKFIKPRPDANYKYLKKEGKADVVLACQDVTERGYTNDPNFIVIVGNEIASGSLTAVEMDPVADENETFKYGGKSYGFLDSKENGHLMVQDIRDNSIYIAGCGNKVVDDITVYIKSVYPTNPSEDFKTYSWEVGSWSDWGSCVDSKKTRVRIVECKDSNGNIVSDSYCASLIPENSETITCSTEQNDCCKDKPYSNSNGSTLGTYTQIQTTGSGNPPLTGNLGSDIRIIDGYYSNQNTQSFAQVPACAQNVLGNQVFFNQFNTNGNKLSGIKYSKNIYGSRPNFRYLKECATGKNYWQRNKGWIIPLGVGILGGTTAVIVSGTGSGSGGDAGYNRGGNNGG